MRELVLKLGVTGKLTASLAAWRTAPLGEVVRLRGGYDLPTQSRNQGSIPIYAANGTVSFHDMPAVKGPGVVTKRSGSIGNVHYVPVDYWPLNTGSYVEDFFGNDPEFACLLLRDLRLERFSTSTAVPTLNRNVVHKELVRVPPLAEQKQIVKKVDELMTLCGRLEAQHQERATRHAALACASLARFADAPTPANLEFLFHKSYDISPADLRKAILTLAVQGKLVPQDPNDEPTSELAKVSSSTLTSGTTEKDAPFNVPRTWRWRRLGQLSELINGDRTKNYPNKAEYVRVGVPWINTGHIEPDGTLSIETMNYITRKKFDSLRSGKIQPRDLVYCLRGATLGKTAIISQFDEGAIASSLVIIRLSPLVDSKFAYCVLTSPLGRQEIRKFDNGSAQPNLSANSVKKYWFPLPTLAEQRRIVAEVDHLMGLVAALESQLITSRASAEKLMEAIVAELTSNNEQTSTPCHHRVSLPA